MISRISNLEFRLGAASLFLLLPGCIGSHISYSPRDNMVMLTRYNHFLSLGPCGSDWNYDTELDLLLPPNSFRAPASELQAFQDGQKLDISSGHVAVDPQTKKVTIDLLLSPPGASPVKSRFNGVHRFTEHDPGPCDITRASLLSPPTTQPQ